MQSILASSSGCKDPHLLWIVKLNTGESFGCLRPFHHFVS